jgi:multicomponent K+:H+ antiporter subunit A
MFDPLLHVPLLLCLTGGLAALLLRPLTLGERLSLPATGWLLAIAPLAAFITLLLRVPLLDEAKTLTFSLSWLPSLGLNASLYLDHLSTLFGLLITGIGTLVVIYAGYYFRGDGSAWRFLCYLLLFMAAMLGLVLAGDLITLFIFWEGTSLTSYLLIGYKYKDEAARRGAFKALVITGGGGIALLGGLVFVAHVAGGTDFQTILASGEVLRASPLYPVMLGLLAFGAFTKSAQFPAHIWLPDAMSAPTPASAFLHSATMVKAGIYLMARLNPALGGTELWFWLLGAFGAATMLVGAYLGLKQNDLKALLAYSTVSQLGVLMLLVGQNTDVAFKALVVGVLAHALYKCALFLVAGIVDHETGTRDLRRLGGLAPAMRVSFVIAAVAGLSMAGLPPLFGFLAKETLLATATHPTVTPALVWMFPTATVIAGALILAQAFMLIYDTFLGAPRDPKIHAHEAPWGMWLAPAIPTLASLIISLLPEPTFMEAFLAGAAGSAFGGKVKVSLALFTGFNLPLALSVVAVTLGGGIFWQRARVRDWQQRVSESVSFNRLYDLMLWLLDLGASWTTSTQSGFLRRYLWVMLLGLGGLLVLFGRLALPAAQAFQLELGELPILRAFALLLATATAAVSVFIRRDLFAILALGASGLGIAVLMVLEPTPDVALVQVVVDILTTVILVLALTRLPRAMRLRATESNLKQTGPGLLRDATLATGAALIMALIVFNALSTRPRTSVVTPFYESSAKPLTGANDMVGAIVVDFRGFDTLIEITVFGMAGLAAYSLLRFAARKHKDDEGRRELARAKIKPTFKPRELPDTILDIHGLRTSPFLQMLAYFLLPLALMVAATHMMYGHDQPGDGFTAGVIISLGVGFWYVIFGYNETKRRLPWLRSTPLIASGILLAVASATVSALLGRGFFAPLDFGAMLGLPLPKGFYLSTSFLFEVAICLTVLGSASLTLDALGHPGEAENGEQKEATDHTGQFVGQTIEASPSDPSKIRNQKSKLAN